MKRKPKVLKPGDTIGIVSPASPVDQADLEKGIEQITARGYHVVLGPHVLDRLDHCDYLAGTDVDRAADINAMFADPSIDAVFCSRGGYGSLRLLDSIDWHLVGRSRKVFVGYSDITSLHLAAASAANLVTFHGPMIGAHARMSEEMREQFWRVLESDHPVLIEDLNRQPKCLVEGAAVGELTGGCLCLLAHACGSRYAPNFDNKIVLLEDVGEAVYRADRALWQLKNAGLLDRAAGFVVGTVTGWRKQEADPPKNDVETMFREILGPLGKPTIMGFPFGHEPDPLLLPLGINVCLDSSESRLTALEGAVEQ
jgi:muramoyltetrapeptide carboxypeptidase